MLLRSVAIPRTRTRPRGVTTAARLTWFRETRETGELGGTREIDVYLTYISLRRDPRGGRGADEQSAWVGFFFFSRDGHFRI